MFKKKPAPKEETKVTKVAEVAKGPECNRCGSTKVYWRRSAVSRSTDRRTKLPKVMGCRACNDVWNVAA